MSERRLGSGGLAQPLMPSLRLASWALGALALWIPGAVGAQVLTGRVMDAESGSGIPSASVEVFDAEGAPLVSTTTGSSGDFRIQLPVQGGPFRLDARAFAYHAGSLDSLQVAAGETLEVGEIHLDRVPILLESVEVEAGRSWITRGEEWVRRGQLLGEGVFFAGALVAMQNPSSLTQFLAEEVGLRVTYNFLHQPFLRSTDPMDNCVRVQVDRWPVGTSPYRNLDGIPLNIIAAIEVYPTRHEVPPELAWDAGRCGLINVWTWNRY
jgi:hypothetical protein